MSKLGAWIKKHGKPFSTRAENGRGTVEVQYYDGYVTIRTRQPGVSKSATTVHITRSAWLKLLKAAPAPTRLMEGPDFDRYRAEREYFREEQLLLAELRAGKRERRGGRRRRR